MKKTLLMLLLAASTVLSACGNGDNKNKQEMLKETTVEETAENGLPLSKQPDPTAPVVDVIFIYRPDAEGKTDKNGNLIYDSMQDSVDKLTGEALFDKLIEHGVLAEGAELASFDVSDIEGETVAAGPGVSEKAEKAKEGILTIKNFKAGKNISEEDAKKSIEKTFVENFELDKFKLEIK